MTVGLSSKLNILQQSPHDLKPDEVETAGPEPQVVQWFPSRYNIRAKTTDGKLVLWNSFHGTMSVFEPEQRPMVEALLGKQGFEARNEGGVKYLHERGYLVKGTTDEFTQFQMAFGNQHFRPDKLELILLASEDCNFRCTYCYENFARGTMKPWVREGIKNLVRQRLPTLRSLAISWFGGEPLYGFEAIEDLAPFFLESAEENSLRFDCHMTTNGYLLTPEVAEKLLAWKIRRFQITLDGPAESHNTSRPTREGEGTFEQIFSNLKALSQRDDEFSVGIRVNFDRNNYERLDHLLDLVEEEFQGDPRFQLRFRAVGKWGGANDEDLDVCGTRESSDIYLAIKKEAAQRGLHLTEDDDLRKHRGVASPTVCYAARPYHFIVGATGKVMKCTIDLDRDDRNVVGQIDRDGHMRIDQDKFVRWTEPAYQRDTKCQKCVVLPVCHGISCPMIRIKEDRSPCISLRSTVKKELLGLAEVARSRTDVARTVTVGETAPAARDAVAATA